MSTYIQLNAIREELQDFYEKNHFCTDIPSVCARLRRHPELFIYDYCNPFENCSDDLQDDEFISLFLQSLYPLDQAERASMQKDSFSYLSDSLFSKYSLFRVFLHENYANQRMHFHDFFEVSYVFKGECTIQFGNDQTILLKEGNVCIIAPGTIHEAVVNDPDSFVFNLSMTAKAFDSAISVVLLQDDLIASYIRTVLYKKGEANYITIPSGNTPEIKRAIKNITLTKRSETSYSYALCISWFSVFICEVMNSYRSNITPESEEISTQAEYFVLLDYIQNNYRTITLEETARHFSYNTAYLSRLIHKLTGNTFSELVSGIKLKTGKALLSDTDFSTEQIAELIGYSSGDYFSKAFKRRFGISAASYRKSLSPAKI